MFPGAKDAMGRQLGGEEYDGDWVDDLMSGNGVYKFTGGSVYTGEWKNGMMNGQGKMIYADGSSYDGTWADNEMDGTGVYIDADKITWEGIFVKGQFDSRVQKRLIADKVIEDKIVAAGVRSKPWFDQFFDAFGKSDKKTFKDNLSPFFGTPETCGEYISVENLPKYEEKGAEKWVEIFKGILEDGNSSFKGVRSKDTSKMIPTENVLVDQLKSKPGG